MLKEAAPWFVAAGIYAGLLAATCIVASIAYDVYADRKDLMSVSEVTLRASWHRPWLAVTATGCLCFAVGALVGHLFLPQIVNHHQMPACQCGRTTTCR